MKTINKQIKHAVRVIGSTLGPNGHLVAVTTTNPNTQKTETILTKDGYKVSQMKRPAHTWWSTMVSFPWSRPRNASRRSIGRTLYGMTGPWRIPSTAMCTTRRTSLFIYAAGAITIRLSSLLFKSLSPRPECPFRKPGQAGEFQPA